MLKQYRIVLRNAGFINPEKIEDYIGNQGYFALRKALLEMTPDEVIKVIKDSGLRGRGGAGFPTGQKWEFAKKAPTPKFIVCNADEGDPGAFMDRSILEGDPHSVIEAMVIAAFATNCDQGFIYVRAEYPLAIHRLNIAMEQARGLNLLGKNIMGTKFSFDIQIKMGAGAFVCGEETSLINSIEGRRGEPRIKPPFPTDAGIWNRPTLVNNVETWANISPIILKGAKWFSSIGTDDSKGTKVFALAGNVKNTGLIEVPMGSTFNDVLRDLGGTDPSDIQAVQTGGPSGGIIARKFFDTKIDYASLRKLGSMMGSGGMIVLDNSTCMVDTAKFYMQFSVDESCGRCTPCRIGNKRMLEMLEKIASGKATPDLLDKLDELAVTIKNTALCGLGQSSPNPVISTIFYFRDKYLEHIEDKRCSSLTCKALVTYQINDKCIGCSACARNCPVSAITGERKSKHNISQDLCIKCNRCFEICKFASISKTSGVSHAN